MQNAMKINEEVTVGPQPNEDDIPELSKAGFKTIVCFRTEGEDEQPLSPVAEGEKVKSAGMKYGNRSQVGGLVHFSAIEHHCTKTRWPKTCT